MGLKKAGILGEVKVVIVDLKRRAIEETEEQRKNGEGSGEDESGRVRTFAVPAEDYAGTLEGSDREDPSQGLGELD